MEFFQTIKSSILKFFNYDDTIRVEPSDTLYWKALRDNKLRTIKDIFSSAQQSPNDLCIPESGHTFLHESIVSNRREIFKLCLIYNADVNRKDINGWTPLLKASSLGRIQMVEELLEHGADPLLADSKGENCLDKAKKFERMDIFNLLVNHLNQTDNPAFSKYEVPVQIEDNERF